MTWSSLPTELGGNLFSLSFSLAASRAVSPSSVSNCFKFLMDFGRRSDTRLVADFAFLGLTGEVLPLSLVLGGLLESLSRPPKALSVVPSPLFVGDDGA
jgi:hypothetical protein